jgi:hypothetical protein
MTKAIEELCKLIDDAGLKVQFGLRQQGHLPTIEQMLKEGKSWEEIGQAIRWDPETAKQWYHDEQLIVMVRDRLQEEFGAELRDWLNQVGALACTCNVGDKCIRCRARIRLAELKKGCG